MIQIPGSDSFLGALEQRLATCKSLDDFESILGDIVGSVSRVYDDRRMSGVVFDSAGLDAILQNTGRALLDFFEVDAVSASYPARQKPLRLYLATELYVSGGHSRMLEDFIAAAPDIDHVIILSDLFGRNGGAAEALHQIERRGASLKVLNDGSLVARTLRIMHFLKTLQPDSCVLFNHHQDAPIIAACLPEFCEHYYFYHHADHNLCLGARVPHLRHLDLSPWQFSRCQDWQDDNIYIPLTCPDRGMTPQGSRPDKPLVTCTAGSWIKFSEPYHVEFRSFIADVVASTRGRHIHIGNLPESVIKDVQGELVARGLDIDAFEHVGWVQSLWLSAQQMGIDVYLSSFPLGGGRGLVEILGAGIPIAFHANPAAPYVCGETLRYPGAICWSYTDQLLDALKALDAAALEKQSLSARAHYDACFSWPSFTACLTRLGQTRNQELMPVAKVPYQDGARYYFDIIQRVEPQPAGEGWPVETKSSAAAVQPLSMSDQLQAWLSARLPTPIQSQLIGDYLGRHAGGPRLGVLVLDLLGDTQQLMKTIRSLGLEQGLYATLKIIALTTAEIPLTRPEAKVHFVSVGADNYIAAINEVVRAADFDWLMRVEAGDEFTPSGLMMAALELMSAPDCRAIYGDEMQRVGKGDLGVALRPAFNLDMLLSFPASMARNWLFRRDLFLASGGFDPAFSGVPEFDLLLRLIEQGGITGLRHVAEPLLTCNAPKLQDNPVERLAIERHLLVRGYPDSHVSSALPGRYLIDYGHPHQPLVSIVLAMRDHLEAVQRCVDSLLEKTHYDHYELLIVDNASSAEDTQAWLAAVESLGDDKIRVLRYPQSYNAAAIVNMGAAAARGDYLLLLDSDTVVIREDWLENLLNHAQRPEVGVVGGRVLYPDGKVHGAGLILGLNGPAAAAFANEPMGAAGYMQRLQLDQDFSAVSASCLMVRRALFDEVGGMDGVALQTAFYDVDLCLKVREAGYLTVWTPHAVLMGEGGRNQPERLGARCKRQVLEQDALYARWLPQLASDPAYNRNLSLNGKGFELELDSNLTWRPLSWRPLPVVLAHPADPWGCGNYRIIKPFAAMKESGQVDGMLSEGLLQVVDLERYNPDVIVLQRQIGDERLEAMRRIKAFSRAFKVYELDDYLPNLPIKSVHREHMPKDILKSLRRGLGFVDRFVVSTQPLAEAFVGLHDDIRVIENRLPVGWWGGLHGARRQGHKPRVGWAGGVSHTGDLELVLDVVRELAGEVEWVFFGMCPDKLRPYVKEIHVGVNIDSYPVALAALNLDLAIAPVEQNLFNECKSNLRLLEYGACGFPVVCSDMVCYRSDLPVTRVKNRFKDWVDAIRMHTNDLDAAARLGDELRSRVYRDWMLDGANVEAWRKAWLPD